MLLCCIEPQVGQALINACVAPPAGAWIEKNGSSGGFLGLGGRAERRVELSSAVNMDGLFMGLNVED